MNNLERARSHVCQAKPEYIHGNKSFPPPPDRGHIFFANMSTVPRTGRKSKWFYEGNSEGDFKSLCYRFWTGSFSKVTLGQAPASKPVHIQSKHQQIWATSLRPEQQYRWTIRTTQRVRSKINMIHIAFLPSFSSLFFSFLLKNRDLLVGEFLDVPTSRWQCSLILVL